MQYPFFFLLLLASAICPAWARAQSQSDFFDPGTLHEIRLEVNPADWRLLKQDYLLNTRYACEFHWAFNGQEVPVPQIAIRSRGQGSRSGIKPSLDVEFDYYDTRQTFLGLQSVVLRANTQDASMMHERVSMELMRRMGLPAPREAHAKLYVNGEYAGLYTIVEPVQRSFLRRVYGQDSGALYNYQYNGFFYFEDRGSNPLSYSPVPFEPQLNGQPSDTWPIAAMVETINKIPDSQFHSEVGRYLDINSFLAEIAVENYLAEQDGLIGDYALNNFFLYRFAGTTVHTFIPWDKSNTFFGRDWPILRNVFTNVLSRRALNFPDYLSFYLATLARAADVAGGEGGWLEQEIRYEYDQIREAAHEDPYKLCDFGATGTLHPCSNEEFEGEVGLMIGFVRQRAEDVRNQIAQLMQNIGATAGAVYDGPFFVQSTKHARLQTAPTER